MEKTLADAGTVLLKFYLHISKEEQLRRFEQRAADPYKHWKISDEDWRNRRKWKEHILSLIHIFETLPRLGRASFRFPGMGRLNSGL